MKIIKTAFAIGLILVASTALAERKEKDLNGAEKSGSEVSAVTEFDLVILNGTVIDPETKLNAVRNIGIINGTISFITEKNISGQKTIDATGKIVSPGFIDLHMHGLNLGAYRMQATQGALGIGVNAGYGPGNGYFVYCSLAKLANNLMLHQDYQLE